MEGVSKNGESLASKLKNGLATAGKVAATGIGAITAAAGAAVGGLLALEQSTEEYRAAMGRLNTAFEAAGYGADTAQEAYRGFYGILGDTDTATEASQLLAQLADSAEDVSVWTNIAAGVNGTFGDSLPIEGLIEAANETAKVGTVTGALADALNWVGISEDEFNERLAKCSSESERNQLIMETLAGQYDEAADAFYRNNEALVESRNAQVQMDAVLAQLGQTVSNIRSQLTAKFLPSIANVATAFNNMLNGVEGADQQFATAVQSLVNQGISLLPQFLSFGTQILTSLLSGIVQSIPTLVSAVPQVVSSIVEALSSLLPQVGAMGVQLLEQMSTGIVEGLPNLIASLPQVVESILDFITDNLPAFLEKGVEMLNYFVTGIIEAIPDMLAQLPAIITAFVEFVGKNLPLIVQAGMEILSNLVIGIIDNLPEIGNAVGQIMAAVVTGVQSLLGDVIQAGKDIVTGIWEGITSMGDWILEKVTGFFGGIVDGAKEFLGIHSPSRVFASIGEYMLQGLAIGLENSTGEVMKTVADIVDEVKSRFNSIYDALTARQDVGDLEYELWERTIGVNATDAEKYEKQLELLGNQEKDQIGIVKAAEAAYKTVVDQYGENSAESYEYQKTLLEEALAYQDIVDQINEVIAAKQELYNLDTATVSYADSTSGRAMEAAVNAVSGGTADQDITLNANLMLPDGSKLATWQLPFLIQAGRAAGTPIANPQVG